MRAGICPADERVPGPGRHRSAAEPCTVSVGDRRCARRGRVAAASGRRGTTGAPDPFRAVPAAQLGRHRAGQRTAEGGRGARCRGGAAGPSGGRRGETGGPARRGRPARAGHLGGPWQTRTDGDRPRRHPRPGHPGPPDPARAAAHRPSDAHDDEPIPPPVVAHDRRRYRRALGRCRPHPAGRPRHRGRRRHREAHRRRDPARGGRDLHRQRADPPAWRHGDLHKPHRPGLRAARPCHTRPAVHRGVDRRPARRHRRDGDRPRHGR